MPHENDYKTLTAGKRHRQARRQMSLEDEDEIEEEERRYGGIGGEESKYRETMAFAASYMQKIRSQATAKSSSSHISSVSTRASSHDESRTSATSILSTSNTGRLGSSGASRGRLSFRASNARGLADIAHKNTISKDNTTGDEVREAELLTNMGKKICNTRQQAKELETGHGKDLPPQIQAQIMEIENQIRAKYPNMSQQQAHGQALHIMQQRLMQNKLDQFLSSPTKSTTRAEEVDGFWDTFGVESKEKRSTRGWHCTYPPPVSSPPILDF